MFEKTLQLISDGVGSAFPCAAVAIGQGHHVFAKRFFGQRQVFPSPLDITEDTLFDLASLTKIVATSMIALQFIESGRLCLDDKIEKWIAEAGNYTDCTVLHLMTHTSGFPAGLPLYEMQHKDCNSLNTILFSDRCCEPGMQVRYSCMGYIVLQNILETVGNAPLDILARKYVFEPLGMQNACYNPERSKRIAATERYKHNGEWATGHVHDENAYYLGGVAGNAGVFATLDDMIAFAGMCSAKGIAKDGTTYLSEESFDRAIENRTPDKTESRGLGFQLKGIQDFPCGSMLSAGSYGHTGFTGTSVYIDAESGLWGVLLTNAVHYGRENRSGYFALRKMFYDTMISEYRSIERSGEK